LSVRWRLRTAWFMPEAVSRTSAGQARNYIAALDTASGQATAWNPGADAAVNTIVPTGDVVYAGGYFSSIGGMYSTGAAGLNISTGSATSWNPGLNSNVMSIGISYLNHTVYFGGDFTEVGTMPESYFAAVQNTGDEALNNPPVFSADTSALYFGTVPSNVVSSDSIVVTNNGGGNYSSAQLSRATPFTGSLLHLRRFPRRAPGNLSSLWQGILPELMTACSISFTPASNRSTPFWSGPR